MAAGLELFQRQYDPLGLMLSRGLGFFSDNSTPGLPTGLALRDDMLPGPSLSAIARQLAKRDEARTGLGDYRIKT